MSPFSPRPLARAVAIALSAGIAVAAPTVVAAQDIRGFLTRAEFEAALLGRADLSLGGLAPVGGTVSYADGSPLVLPAGLFGAVTAAGPGFEVVDQGAVDLGRAATARPLAPTRRITLSFSSPITAFGADYLPNTGSASQTFTLSAPGLGTYDLVTGETGWRFFGITSDTPFSSAVITADAPIFYDLPTVGEADQALAGAAFQLPPGGATLFLPLVAVPEPHTVALLAAGLGALGLAGAARRRR